MESNENNSKPNEPQSSDSIAEHSKLCIPKEILIYEFEIPVDLCKYLIGKKGSNIRDVTGKTGTNISFLKYDGGPTKICSIKGHKEQIDGALQLIRARFPLTRFPQFTLAQTNAILTFTQLQLPFGLASDVHISTTMKPNHIFVQLLNNPTFSALAQFNHCMDLCYKNAESAGLPKQIQVGTLCVAPYNDIWYRAMVVQVICPDLFQGVEVEEEVVVRFVDYGGYRPFPASSLRMIRQEFLSLPFQAIECFLANVAPHSAEQGWTSKEYEELKSLTKQRKLEAQVITYSHDGLPVIYLYSKNLMENQKDKQLVNLGVGKWTDSQLFFNQTCVSN